MKNAIVKNSLNSITGYKIVFTDENNIVNEIEINETDPKNDKILKLPENPSNRKWLSKEKVDKNDGELILEYKETRTIENKTPRKGWEEYLTEEEKIEIENAKKIIDNIINNAKKRKEENKKKPMSEREKLEEKIRKLREKLESLENEEG